MRFETLAVHAGHEPDSATGAVTSPIYLSTTFERAADGSYPGGHVYARTSNPNRVELERCLAALEGGAVAATFASGSAATMSLLHALSPGEHVLAPNDAYYGTAVLMRDLYARWGLEVEVESSGLGSGDVGDVPPSVMALANQVDYLLTSRVRRDPGYEIASPPSERFDGVLRMARRHSAWLLAHAECPHTTSTW